MNIFILTFSLSQLYP